jgi:glycosyltransferase involved in cell wall biosynthesis
VLFESSHLDCFFNGTFTVTSNLVTHFVEQFSSRYECWISCNADALRFHGLDRINGLYYAGDNLQASAKGPYFAALRLAQPFSLLQLLQVSPLAPLSGFLMLDTIAMDCQNLDDYDLRTVWSRMARTVGMVGYISQYTADQMNRRFCIPDSVAQATILLSTNPVEYVPDTKAPSIAPSTADYLLLVGNHYSHKHLRETIDIFRARRNWPALKVLGLKIENEEGISGLASGDLDQATVNNLYRDSRAIVFPSHYEGFGLPVMQALGHKKPVFARAIPVLEEIQRRAPGGANLHLFGSTEEIVHAALVGATWQEHCADPIDMQTWAKAACEVEALMRQAESKLSHRALHERVLEMSACEEVQSNILR